MKHIWTVFGKEVVDNLRDRRSLTSSLMTPLFSPVLLVALIIVLGQTLFQDPQEKPLILPVSGAEHAPNLVRFLEQNNVQLVDAPADPESAVREGDVDIVLIIPDGYADEVESGHPAGVRLVMDSSRQSALSAISRTRDLLSQYGGTIGILRLQARGLDPSIINSISVEVNDVSTPESQTLLFLNMMPFLIITTIFVGGMYVIIDATAGERERGSLEPLLINPVPRWQFVIAKILASLPFALVTLLITLGSFYAAFNLFPLEELVNMPLAISAGSLLDMFWLSLPMLILASALQVLVATYTRSFKEAQTYLSLLPLVTGFPTAFLMFVPVKATIGMMSIPIFSQAVLITKVLRAETILPLHVVISTLITLLVSGLVVFIAIRLFEREQILVGR